MKDKSVWLVAFIVAALFIMATDASFSMAAEGKLEESAVKTVADKVGQGEEDSVDKSEASQVDSDNGKQGEPGNVPTGQGTDNNKNKDSNKDGEEEKPTAKPASDKVGPDGKASVDKSTVAKAEKERTRSDWHEKVVVLQITDPKGIEWNRHTFIRSELEKVFARVRMEKPRLLVVEINSPGGRVDTCNDLSQMLKKCEVKTVAVILHEAVSGGTVIATACNDIYMIKGSRIGDVKPILMIPGPIPKELELSKDTMTKLEQDVITLLKSNCEANGHPMGLMRAMVRPHIELYRIEMSDGEVRFLTTHELAILEENIKLRRERREIKGKKILCTKEELLELTAGEAVKYGLAKKVVRSLDDFYKERGVTQDDIVYAKVSNQGVKLSSVIAGDSGEDGLNLAGWQIAMVLIFLIIGIAGAFTEAHMPGFGIPGAISIIGFACLFYLLFRAGNANIFEVMIFVVGIALLVVEIVVIPGFGVPGVLGILCLLAGLFLAFTPDLSGVYMQKHWAEAGGIFVLVFFGGLTAGLLLTYGLVTYGSKLPIVKGIFLTAAHRSGVEVRAEMKVEAEREQEAFKQAKAYLVGKKGVAVTALRPAGKIRLDDGETLSVVSDGGLIKEGVRVKVFNTEMNRILVVPSEDGSVTKES